MSSQSYVTIGFSMFQFCFVKLGSVAIVQHHNSTSPHVVLYIYIITAILTSIHVSKAPESRTAAVAFQQLRACRPVWGSQAPGCCTIHRHYPSRTGYVTGYITGYSTVPRCSAEYISKTDSPKTTICKICDPRWLSRIKSFFFSKMMSERTPLLGWLRSWYTDGARQKLVMCAGSFDGNTIPGTNG